MRLEDIKKAWNKQADKHNQWDALDADERVEFALAHITRVTRQALEDLGVAVYRPQDSSISVAHALGHVQHYLTTPNPKLTVPPLSADTVGRVVGTPNQKGEE